MAYNGSGTFNITTAGQPVVTGTVISSTAFNALTADLATGLSTAITKDGQTTTTARILFAQGVSSTLVTDATSATTGSIITAGGISMQKALWVGTTSRHVGAATFDAAITYGGVTLSNSVTGTGSMVLSASPTLTGTVSAAAITATGNIAAANYYSSASAFRVGYSATYSYIDVYGSAGDCLVFGTTATERARIGTDGSFLVGTTTNGGWGTDSKIEGKTSTGCGVSGYATGAGGAAVRARTDNATGVLFAGYGSAALRLQLTTDAGGNTNWLSAGTASVIAGGSGGVSLASGATAWAAVSDETLKTDLALIQSGAEKVASLRAVTGRYKTDAESMSRSFLIAQDVQKVLPEAVSTDADGTLSLRYAEVIPLMVAAIQELTTRLAALENK